MSSEAEERRQLLPLDRPWTLAVPNRSTNTLAAAVGRAPPKKIERPYYVSVQGSNYGVGFTDPLDLGWERFDEHSSP